MHYYFWENCKFRTVRDEWINQLLFPLKSSENHGLSDDFRGNRSWSIRLDWLNIWRRIWRRSLIFLKTLGDKLFIQRSLKTVLSYPSGPSLNSCPISLKSTFKSCINPFHATGPFQHPLKTTENQRSTDVFRGYWKRPVVWNGLTVLHVSYCFIHTSFVAFSIKHWSVAIIACFKASDASVKKLSDDTSFINNWDAV